VTPFDRNPYHVLGLEPGCTALEVERAARKVLAMLAVGYTGATTYDSPLGVRPRDATLVRWAAGELRTPELRVQHAADAVPVATAEPPDDRLAPWVDALEAFGWGPRAAGRTTW
jgi:hypothetical protein